MIHETLPTYEDGYTDNLEANFGPLPEVVAYDTYFVDPQNGLDPYWDEHLQDEDKLEYKDTYNKPNDQIESDDLITDASVSDAPQFALIDLSTLNPLSPDTSALPSYQVVQPRQQYHQRHIAV